MNNNVKLFSVNDVASKDPSYLETIFSLANGHLGVRASDPVVKSDTAGTIVNGFYELSDISYGEKAYGYAEHNQTIIKLPDINSIKILDADKHEFSHSQLIDETLDMEQGLVVASYKLTNDQGQAIELTLQTALDQLNSQIIGLRYQIRPIDYMGKITVSKHLSAPEEASESDDPRKSRAVHTLTYSKHKMSDVCEFLHVETKYSQMFLNMELYSYGDLKQQLVLKQDGVLTLDFICVVSNVNEEIRMAKLPSFDEVLADSTKFWQEFWKNSEVNITGDEKLNQALHYNLFQLTSSTGRDGKTNIPAKGLSGTGYEGHYFWDTEMYMSPFFDYTNPDIAKDLIEYRYHILDKSKARARKLGVNEGALFAWRTINGEEASAYYPAGTAQYHIDADIAYAIYRYYAVTRDTDFIRDYGFPIVLETARFWKNFGSYSKIDDKKQFCFFDVTGPDEYTAIVNNNYYTNRMAKFNLEFAAELCADFPEKAKELGVTAEERAELAKLSEDVYLPFDEDKGINKQDDSAFDKPIWPFATTPKENYPLLLHYHPLTIYRYQVNKQADTLLADFLFDDISQAQLVKEYDYYEKITTHDSSLSRSIFSALAARIGLKKKAYSYFTDTVRTDLTDLQGNTADGLHVANLGGSWLTVAMGFGGLEFKDNKLVIQNHLPDEWDKLTVRIRYQKRLLRITYLKEETNVEVLEGSPLTINVDGKDQLIR